MEGWIEGGIGISDIVTLFGSVEGHGKVLNMMIKCNNKLFQ